MKQCCKMYCKKTELEDILYTVEYKIHNGLMTGKAYFCLEHLPITEDIITYELKHQPDTVTKQIVKYP